MVKLRKVFFNLNELNLTVGDLHSDGNYEDNEDITIERIGLFHRWGDVTYYDSKLERYIQKTVAIVEEIETGKIYEVAPKCITFEKLTDEI